MSGELIERLRAWAETPFEGDPMIDALLVDVPAAADEIERLRAEVDRLTVNGTHTCHDQCGRPACVLRRENEVLRAELSALRGEDAAVIARLVGALEDIATVARSPVTMQEIARQALTDTAAQRQSVSPRPRRKASPSEVKTGRQGIGEE